MEKKSKYSQEDYRDFCCDICRDTQAIEVPYVRNYTNGQVIHICKKCGFIYVKKRRSFDRIARVWSKELFGKSYTARTPLMLARHMYVAEFIDQNLLLKGKKLCDIGAGEGQFLKIAKENYSAQVFGIEPSAANCGIMKNNGISNFQGTLEDYVASPGAEKYKADIVTMMWTLENATSCRGLVMGARSILKDNGYLVVATGSRILVPFAKPLNLYLSHNPVDTHPSRFSLNALSNLLSLSGFTVEYTNPYLNDNLVLCVIARKAKLNRKFAIKIDDYKKVCEFFRRWHKETSFYK